MSESVIGLMPPWPEGPSLTAEQQATLASLLSRANSSTWRASLVLTRLWRLRAWAEEGQRLLDFSAQVSLPRQEEMVRASALLATWATMFATWEAQLTPGGNERTSDG